MTHKELIARCPLVADNLEYILAHREFLPGERGEFEHAIKLLREAGKALAALPVEAGGK